MSFAGRGPEPGPGLRQAQGLGPARPAGPRAHRRSPAGRWGRSRGIRERHRLRLPAARRHRARASRPASTSCSRTGAGWATRSSPQAAVPAPRAWPPRTRGSPGCGPTAWPDVPQYKVDIDWEKAGALGVPVSSIQSYLSTAFGSAYIDNFVQGGRVKRVYAQADAPFRMLPERPRPAPRPQPPGRTGARSPPSPPAAGSTARRGSSGTTASRP